MDSAYLNWARGNRLTNYVGFESINNTPIEYSSDYLELRVKLLEAYNPKDETVVTEAKANQLIRLYPACTLDIKKYRVQIEPNPKLLEYAMVAMPRILSCDDVGAQPIITAKFFKAMNFKELDYLVKMFLVG
jgi:hypothetical protein